MKNLQIAEKQVLSQGHLLDVVNVWPTIQGEGPDVGTPAVFVRLAGCDLQCPGCDTDYTTGRTQVPLDNLIERIRTTALTDRKIDLVVLSGGEPFRQNIVPLCNKLVYEFGMYVSIESNGTYPLPGEPRFHQGETLPDQVLVVVSPKTAKIRFGEARIDAYKYIIKAGDVRPEDGLPIHALDNPADPYIARPSDKYPREQIYVQPMDEGDPDRNKANIDAAIRSCMKFGYRMSLQTHKILGLE